MNLLTLETSTEACSVALQWQGKVYSDHRVIPKQHNQFLLPMIEGLLKTAGISLKQLDAIAVGVGPGSFVGTRLAVSVAQGLAYGADIPVIPVSSMHIWAQTIYRETAQTKITLAVDGRMQAFYVGEYELKNGLMTMLKEDHTVIADSEDLQNHYLKMLSLILPNAIDAIPLALKKPSIAADQVEPLYLREASLWKKSAPPQGATQ